MKIPITIDFNSAFIREHFTKEQAYEFIRAIDFEYSEVSFTEKLIIELAKSLKCDLSDTEWEVYDTFLKEIDPNYVTIT